MIVGLVKAPVSLDKWWFLVGLMWITADWSVKGGHHLCTSWFRSSFKFCARSLWVSFDVCVLEVRIRWAARSEAEGEVVFQVFTSSLWVQSSSWTAPLALKYTAVGFCRILFQSNQQSKAQLPQTTGRTETSTRVRVCGQKLLWVNSCWRFEEIKDTGDAESFTNTCTAQWHTTH